MRLIFKNAIKNGGKYLPPLSEIIIDNAAEAQRYIDAGVADEVVDHAVIDDVPQLPPAIPTTEKTIEAPAVIADEAPEIADDFTTIKGIGRKIHNGLADAGIFSFRQFLEAPRHVLLDVDGISEKNIGLLLNNVKNRGV